MERWIYIFKPNIIIKKLLTNRNLYLFSILAFLFGGMNLQSKADDLDLFWKGAGVGAAETLCLLTNDHSITNATAKMYMRAYRTNLGSNSSFRSRVYEECIEVANETHGFNL